MIFPPLSINIPSGQKFPLMVVGGHWYGTTSPDGLIEFPLQPLGEMNRFSKWVVSFDFVPTTISTNTSSYPYFDPHLDDLTTYWVGLGAAMLYASAARWVDISWIAIGL